MPQPPRVISLRMPEAGVAEVEPVHAEGAEEAGEQHGDQPLAAGEQAGQLLGREPAATGLVTQAASPLSWPASAIWRSCSKP